MSCLNANLSSQTEVFNLFPVPVLKTKLDYPVNEIEVLCQQEHSKNPTGVIKSNNGGWQSSNIIYPDSPFFFLSDIEKICQEFCKETLKIDKTILLKNAWININQKFNSNQSHTHPGCILSGVYYIKTPKGCGDIHFQHHSIDMMTRDWSNFVNRNWYSEYNQYNSELWLLPSKEGCLYVFPSWIRHMVKPNMSDEERISISFNVG